ncbi:MAG: DNA-3-methyladenine glycosylase 2 family protein [Saprospiraceae bacterium]|nr:DNA-3-methyladenine glycosylase 2 family protein [Saprospiraceae bacterium]
MNESSLLEASAWLAERDEALAFVLQRYGPPPLWAREPGFSTLVHIILEQQVSLASANAAFQKLKALLGGLVEPEPLLALSDEALRQAGFSRQKTLYCRHLAQTIVNGHLHLPDLSVQTEEQIRHTLKQLKGIGDWTVDIYLSECLLYPDILPKGDIAMLEAFKVLKKLPARPIHDVFLAGTEHWRPWRSVGTRMLWHYYLEARKEVMSYEL